MNICSISAKSTILFSWNLKITPKRLLSKSGPFRRLEFKDWPSNAFDALATRRTFPGLFSLLKGWWGRNKVFSFGCSFVGLFFLKKPFCKSFSSVFLCFCFLDCLEIYCWADEVVAPQSICYLGDCRSLSREDQLHNDHRRVLWFFPKFQRLFCHFWTMFSWMMLCLSFQFSSNRRPIWTYCCPC